MSEVEHECFACGYDDTEVCVGVASMLADLIARGTLEVLAGTTAFRRGSRLSASTILMWIKSFAPFFGADSAVHRGMK